MQATDGHRSLSSRFPHCRVRHVRIDTTMTGASGTFPAPGAPRKFNERLPPPPRNVPAHRPRAGQGDSAAGLPFEVPSVQRPTAAQAEVGAQAAAELTTPSLPLLYTHSRFAANKQTLSGCCFVLDGTGLGATRMHRVQVFKHRGGWLIPRWPATYPYRLVSHLVRVDARCLDRFLARCLRYKDSDEVLWIWVNKLKTQQASIC